MRVSRSSRDRLLADAKPFIVEINLSFYSVYDSRGIKGAGQLPWYRVLGNYRMLYHVLLPDTACSCRIPYASAAYNCKQSGIQQRLRGLPRAPRGAGGRCAQRTVRAGGASASDAAPLAVLAVGHISGTCRWPGAWRQRCACARHPWAPPCAP